MDFTGVTGGIFQEELIRALIHEHALFGAFPDTIRDIFLDITATQEIYRIPGAILPQKGERVRSLLKKISAIPLPANSPLEGSCSYLIRIRETLVLPSEVFARFSSPASTTFDAELLGDGVCFLNELTLGYTGELWIHLIPHKGPFFLDEDHILGSLSFFKKYSPASLGDILTLHQTSPIFFDRDEHAILPILHEDRGIFLSLYSETPLFTTPFLQTEVHTEERLHLPKTLAACIQSSHQTHFLPPGFGDNSKNGSSVPLTLHTSKHALWRSGQPLCTLEFIPVAQQKKESPALYTPDPEENPKIE